VEVTSVVSTALEKAGKGNMNRTGKRENPDLRRDGVEALFSPVIGAPAKPAPIFMRQAPHRCVFALKYTARSG
jgi:hypothetical protein